MQHHDLRAALSGIALGLLLGAGTLGTLQQHVPQATDNSSLTAKVHFAATREFNRRNIDRKGVPLWDDSGTNSFPTVRPDVADVTVEKTETTCDAVRAAVESIRKAYDTVVPVNPKTTAARLKMDAAFADAVRSSCK